MKSQTEQRTWRSATDWDQDIARLRGVSRRHAIRFVDAARLFVDLRGTKTAFSPRIVENQNARRDSVRMLHTTPTRRWLFLSLAGALVCVALTIAILKAGGSSRAAVTSAPIALVPEVRTIAALGRIEPQSEIINVGSGVVDRLESLLVRRGDVVKKNQIMGYLQSFAEQTAQREQIAAELREAKTKLVTEIELDKSRIENAEIKLRTINEVSPMKIAGQEAVVKGIEVVLQNNRKILEAQAQLLDHNSTSRRIYDDQQAQVLQGEANLISARAHLTELTLQFEADRKEAESQVRIAKAAMERSRADMAIDSLTRQLELADARVARTTICAPIDGRILNILKHPGELVENSAILTMGNTDKMRAVAEVYETDIGMVRAGQSARITSRVLKTPISGRVAEVGQMIFKNDVLNVDPAAKSDARVVEVRIDLDDTERSQFLTNHTVDVVIDVDDTPLAKPQQQWSTQ